MKKIGIFRRVNETAIAAIVIIIALFFYVGYRSNKTKTDGVYTIAKVTGFKGAASGSFTYLDIYYQNKIYQTSIDELCNQCMGKYYFVKVNLKNISQFPHFYSEKAVPECILDTIKYYPGWKQIPDCD